MCRIVRSTFACEPASVRQTREWVRAQLGSLYADLDNDAVADIGLTVSELVTNCVRAEAHELTVSITAHRTELVLATTDDAPGVPEMMSPDQNATSGRGLQIVAALTEDWGVEPDDGTKTVWARFSLSENSTSVFDCPAAS